MKIYLDVCCFYRPFDVPDQERIRLEAEAVAAILKRCLSGDWSLVSSEVVEKEVQADPDPERRAAVRGLESGSARRILLEPSILRRAAEFATSISGFDALHIAAAERGSVDVFLSTDDDLLKRARSLDLPFDLLNPVEFLERERHHG